MINIIDSSNSLMSCIKTQECQRNEVSKMMANSSEVDSAHHTVTTITGISMIAPGKASKWELSRNKYQAQVSKRLKALSIRAVGKWKRPQNNNNNDILSHLNAMSDAVATKWEKSRGAHEVEILAILNSLPILPIGKCSSKQGSSKQHSSKQCPSKQHFSQKEPVRRIQKADVKPIPKRVIRTPISRWSNAELQNIKQCSERMYKRIRYP